MLKLGLCLLLLSFCKDSLYKEMPDRYDLKLSKIDQNYLNSTKENTKTTEDTIFENNQRLDNQVSTLKNYLEIDEVYSLTSTKLWEKIYNYIVEHLNEFLENNQLSFKMHIRYNFCFYVIPLLPTEYFVVFPSFYKYFIPYKYRNEKAILNFTNGIDGFLKEIKNRRYKEILTVFYVKRSGTAKDEIEMIKKIPEMIKNEPMALIRWIMGFKVEIL